MIPTTRIRSATPDDAPALARVDVAAWRTAYRGIMPADFLDSFDENERRVKWGEILTKDAPQEFHFVAEERGRIIGFASGGPERKNALGFDGELYAIYLLDEFRRQAIGTELLERSIESLLSLGMESMKVWVLKDSPFRAFYEKHGGFLLPDGETIRIAELELVQVAYGWSRLNKTT